MKRSGGETALVTAGARFVTALTLNLDGGNRMS